MLFDFIPQQYSVEAGGRLFVCRPPTLRALFLFLSAFRVQVYAMARGVREAGQPVEVEQVLPLFVGAPTFPWVLAECVTSPGMERNQVVQLLRGDTGLQASCAMQCLALCDVGRIVRWIDSEKLAADNPAATPAEMTQAETEVPSDMEIAICELAQRYGQSPMDVMRWPIEAFVAALAVGATARPMSGAVPAGAERVDLDRL